MIGREAVLSVVKMRLPGGVDTDKKLFCCCACVCLEEKGLLSSKISRRILIIAWGVIGKGVRKPIVPPEKGKIGGQFEVNNPVERRNVPSPPITMRQSISASENFGLNLI